MAKRKYTSQQFDIQCFQVHNYSSVFYGSVLEWNVELELSVYTQSFMRHCGDLQSRNEESSADDRGQDWKASEGSKVLPGALD